MTESKTKTDEVLDGYRFADLLREVVAKEARPKESEEAEFMEGASGKPSIGPEHQLTAGEVVVAEPNSNTPRHLRKGVLSIFEKRPAHTPKHLLTEGGQIPAPTTEAQQSPATEQEHVLTGAGQK